ncbi:MAG: hypothetical protein HS111_36560 [Kofleriaceae bacterium]|nr:hypothetical protein [Kofleriaceae bacterium]
MAGAAIAPAVQVTARDAFGNTATGFTGTVTVSRASGRRRPDRHDGGGGGGRRGDVLEPVARAGGELHPGRQRGGLAGATSVTFSVTPAAAAALVFTVQPSTTVAGAAIAPAVQVTARDAFSNTATRFTGTVTVARASGPVTPLGGTTAVAAVGGVATFSNLSLELVGSYTLGASSGGLTPATSATFDVTPAAAAALFFTVSRRPAWPASASARR